MIYDSHVDARAAFLQAAKDRPATLAEHAFHGAKGRLREPPALDVAVVGDPGDSKTLLIVSGTHGLEGLPGSGAELELLLRAHAPPADVKIVLVDTLYPSGASHGSRTNEDSVDCGICR